MTRIDKPIMLSEVNNIQTSNSRKESNVSVYDNNQTDIKAEKFAKDIYRAFQTNDFATIHKQLMLLYDNIESQPEILDHICYQYILNSNNKSFISQMVKYVQENKENYPVDFLDKIKKNISKINNSVANNKLVAYNLLHNLNGDNKNSILENLDNIDENNIYWVTENYSRFAIEFNETVSKRTVIQKIIGATRGDNILSHANNKETLVQGILNAPTLSISEKRDIINKLKDLYIKAAENKGIDKDKIEDYKQTMEDQILAQIRDITGSGYAEKAINGYWMDEAYINLFKGGK